MTKNIKEIGKELLGKSLNSFHRKTGLTQLEENNKMQDGILNGILSQVDDAYIEKTEQSNVIHLDGSGDGVVVLDGIEGNTMVNYNLENKIITRTSSEAGIQYKDFRVIGKPNTEYTAIINVTKNTTSGSSYFNWGIYIDGATRGDNNLCNGSTPFIDVQRGKTGILMCKFTSRNNLGSNPYLVIGMHDDWQSSYEMEIKDIILLEGDYTNKEVNFFEGMQSSFEEHKTDEGKYEIEILMNNKNLFDYNKIKDAGDIKKENGVLSLGVYSNQLFNMKLKDFCNHLKLGETYKFSLEYDKNGGASNNVSGQIRLYNGSLQQSVILNQPFIYDERFLSDEWVLIFYGNYPSSKSYFKNIQLERSSTSSNYTPQKQNKIKLLINEPLRSVGDIRDKFVFKDNKLMIQRNVLKIMLDNNSKDISYTPNTTYSDNYLRFNYRNEDVAWGANIYDDRIYCDTFPNMNHQLSKSDCKSVRIHGNDSLVIFYLHKNEVSSQDADGFKKWLRNNPTSFVCARKEPYYEEVLNEYGEPILLEGYENGTLYIDSIIVPTTTVRYTPKMESFNVIKKVNNNNVMLTSDINDMIVPYIMEIDMIIMEKEFALMSARKTRRIGEKDMTNMQKRTYDMLVRLIKGKTLTVEECKTRVTVYLNADKITDALAEELMLLIDEVYA